VNNFASLLTDFGNLKLTFHCNIIFTYLRAILTSNFVYSRR